MCIRDRRIPHPYTMEDARQFLTTIDSGGLVRFAVTLRSDGRLIGGVGLNIEEQHERAELGYWLGVQYWGKGLSLIHISVAVPSGRTRGK